MAEASEVADKVEGDHSEEDLLVKEASGQGWVPKDKFKGKEDDWVDAQTFIKRGKEILPILRKNNESLLKELNQTKESLREFKTAADEFKKFQKESYERKARELEREITELKSARAQAITDGDGVRANALDEAIDTAKDEVKAAKASAVEVAKPMSTAPTGLDPKLQIWLDRNEWFGKDKMMTSITNAIGETIRTENPSLIGDAFLSKLDEALQEKFPEMNGKKRVPNYQTESGGRGSRPAAVKKSYENLPSEAKAACDRFTKQKLMTREQYVSEFEWE